MWQHNPSDCALDTPRSKGRTNKSIKIEKVIRSQCMFTCKKSPATIFIVPLGGA